MKHRRNKVKREHGIIQNALPWLENLSCLPEVTDIIPGVIDVNRSSERGIVYKYKTQTGCKLLLKSSGSIQEAFVVTKNPERVLEWVEQEFPMDSSTGSPQEITQNAQQKTPKKKLASISMKTDVRSKDNLSVSLRMPTRKKRLERNASKAITKKVVDLNLADHLDNSTVIAMNHLKKSLENAKFQSTKPKVANKYPRK